MVSCQEFMSLSYMTDFFQQKILVRFRVVRAVPLMLSSTTRSSSPSLISSPLSLPYILGDSISFFLFSMTPFLSGWSLSSFSCISSSPSILIVEKLCKRLYNALNSLHLFSCCKRHQILWQHKQSAQWVRCMRVAASMTLMKPSFMNRRAGRKFSKTLSCWRRSIWRLVVMWARAKEYLFPFKSYLKPDQFYKEKQ